MVLRRSLLLAGFLLGCGLVALASAGSAQADEQDRPSRSSQTPGESTPGGGLLGGLLEPAAPAVSSVFEVTGPAVSGVSRVAAPVVEPVVGVVEPVVTAPLPAPVTEPLSPALELLAPVTEPLLGPAEPVVTPVERALGIRPQALGVDPTRASSQAPASVGIAADVDRSDVGAAVPAETSPPPSSTGSSAAVKAIAPPWTRATTATSNGKAVHVAASQWHGGHRGGPGSPRPDQAVLAGATGTASSGGNAGGVSGQADLPGHQGIVPHDGVQMVYAERWLLRPWCYVFGRHHPS
ncbi:hypothetical protein [Saccharothrix hoggarensis]|uniref:Uncharacterized protein n=1 Tax=Saccharothrix hoggarensis TaxID=913853 RepID=A0ABW3QIT4_9PSEU